MASFDAIDKAQGDWLLGAQSAYKDYLASASDVAGQSASLFASAFDGMSNSLANFVTTGKGNFKGLATSIIGDLAKMELRVAESKILQSILSAFMGGTVDNSAAGAGSVSAGLGDG